MTQPEETIWRLGPLLTVHEAMDIAKRHCGDEGRRYADLQLAVEWEISAALARGDESKLRHDDQFDYLAHLRELGKAPKRKV
jgi:hypothetical protein